MGSFAFSLAKVTVSVVIVINHLCFIKRNKLGFTFYKVIPD